MADILRSWNCLNSRCGAVFDAWEANPSCPSCGCVRVAWVPGGGHIGRTAGAVDADFRSLADCYGLTDMVSGPGGAKPVKAPPPVDRHAQPVTFAPGFSAPVDPSRAVCVPTGMTVKTTTGVGMPLQPNRLAGAMRGNTRVEARHTGRSA